MKELKALYNKYKKIQKMADGGQTQSQQPQMIGQNPFAFLNSQDNSPGLNLQMKALQQADQPDLSGAFSSTSSLGTTSDPTDPNITGANNPLVTSGQATTMPVMAGGLSDQSGGAKNIFAAPGASNQSLPMQVSYKGGEIKKMSDGGMTLSDLADMFKNAFGDTKPQPSPTPSPNKDKYQKIREQNRKNFDDPENNPSESYYDPNMANGGIVGLERKTQYSDGGKIEHDKKNLLELKAAFDKFISEEGKEKLAAGGLVAAPAKNYSKGGKTKKTKKMADGGDVKPSLSPTPKPTSIGNLFDIPGQDKAADLVKQLPNFDDGGDVSKYADDPNYQAWRAANPNVPSVVADLAYENSLTKVPSDTSMPSAAPTQTSSDPYQNFANYASAQGKAYGGKIKDYDDGGNVQDDSNPDMSTLQQLYQKYQDLTTPSYGSGMGDVKRADAASRASPVMTQGFGSKQNDDLAQQMQSARAGLPGAQNVKPQDVSALQQDMGMVAGTISGLKNMPEYNGTFDSTLSNLVDKYNKLKAQNASGDITSSLADKIQDILSSHAEAGKDHILIKDPISNRIMKMSTKDQSAGDIEPAQAAIVPNSSNLIKNSNYPQQVDPNRSVWAVVGPNGEITDENLSMDDAIKRSDELTKNNKLNPNIGITSQTGVDLYKKGLKKALQNESPSRDVTQSFPELKQSKFKGGKIKGYANGELVEPDDIQQELEDASQPELDLPVNDEDTKNLSPHQGPIRDENGLLSGPKEEAEAEAASDLGITPDADELNNSPDQESEEDAENDMADRKTTSENEDVPLDTDSTSTDDQGNTTIDGDKELENQKTALTALVAAQKNPQEDLQKAQKERDLNVLGQKVAKYGALAGAGLLGRPGINVSPEPVLKMIQSNDQYSNLPIQKYQEQLANQQNDPNSTVSQAAKALYKKVTGSDAPDSWSAADLSKVDPIFAHYAQAQAMTEARKEHNQDMDVYRQQQLDFKKQQAQQAAQDKAEKAAQKQEHDFDQENVKLNNDIQRAKSRGSVTKAYNATQAADRFMALVNEYPNLDNMPPPQVALLNSEVATMAKGGSAAPSDSDRKEIGVPTLSSGWAKASEGLQNIPVGAGQGDFIRNNMKYVQGLKNIAGGVISQSVTPAIDAHRRLMRPEDFEAAKLANAAYYRPVNPVDAKMVQKYEQMSEGPDKDMLGQILNKKGLL